MKSTLPASRRRKLIVGAVVLGLALAVSIFAFFTPKVLQPWRNTAATKGSSRSIAVLPSKTRVTIQAKSI